MAQFSVIVLVVAALVVALAGMVVLVGLLRNAARPTSHSEPRRG
ncbi:hypothetical protein [Brooklawnia cerclae]|uniref:NADH dehydrogenase subunit 3 n=1 Tax=Brooklawnia cerclae TaxID=349934 RepID=A0ABX0SFZ9_9ACTN|nr:hypothetical protein [Brooklawnia cerclae]NIH55612.1 hypothetical protein [Brooklawnia cerclae]